MESDELLRAAAIFAGEQSTSEPCPTAARLVSYRERGAPEEDAITMHLVTCPTCQDRLSSIGSGGGDQSDDDPPPEHLRQWAREELRARFRGNEAPDRKPQRPPRRPFARAVAAVGATAALVSISFGTGILGTQAVPEYRAEGPRGISTVRDPSAERPAIERYEPSTPVRIDLAPSAPLEDDPPLAGLFIEGAGGVLARASSAAFMPVEGGGYRLRVEAREVLGAQAGRFTLLAALVASERELRALEGRRISDLASGDQLRFWTWDGEYSLGEAPPEE